MHEAIMPCVYIAKPIIDACVSVDTYCWCWYVFTYHIHLEPSAKAKKFRLDMRFFYDIDHKYASGAPPIHPESVNSIGNNNIINNAYLAMRWAELRSFRRRKQAVGVVLLTYVPVPIITQMIKAGNNMQCIDSSSNRRRDLHARPALYPISICLPWTLLTISIQILPDG